MGDLHAPAWSLGSAISRPESAISQQAGLKSDHPREEAWTALRRE
jgi:hypothetical protein